MSWRRLALCCLGGAAIAVALAVICTGMARPSLWGTEVFLITLLAAPTFAVALAILTGSLK